MFDILFSVLCKKGKLESTGNVLVEQQIYIFLYIVSNNAFNLTANDRFQLTGKIIWRYFNKVLNTCEGLSSKLIKLCEKEKVLKQLVTYSKFIIYFNVYISVLNDTLISATLLAEAQATFLCRKGYPAQDILTTCGFNMMFEYIHTNWNHSVNDTKI